MTRIQPIDILIVCGQGTYQDGRFYTEYSERDLYLQHALETRHLVHTFGYNTLVASGSFTRPQTPMCSESQSFKRIWSEYDRWPLPSGYETTSYVWEQSALDSAQNVLFSLLETRLYLRHTGRGHLPIRRIGVHCLWKFKRERFTLLARALGIEERFYFHGLAHAIESLHPTQTLQGERTQVERIQATQDPLLLDSFWEKKRQQRNVSPTLRQDILGPLEKAFPKCFSALSAQQWQHDKEGTHHTLRTLFEQDVLSGT